MRYWLMKSEPNTYSIDDLERDGSSMWEGVRNYQARNFMRDDMSIGDMVLFYHSNCKPPGIAGIGRVCSTPYPDPTAFDPKSPYFDPKSKQKAPRWILIDVDFVEHLPRLVSLPELRKIPELSEMLLLKKGQRLSIQPVTEEEFNRVHALGQS